ncbi:VOC family protein [Cytobacillus sp. IB215316]|uniref:VOC family protein n=1 Tax=Cytobacillus sp. IB215316 TaxID=3097354 RepID=UPI002A173B34|nr:VOC family protein [Cytobacillus sp. IB215316]MDX8361973.1 VOC family protein [Cytobacillus sp. IB215316]
MQSPIKNQLNITFVPVSNMKESVKWYSHLLGQNYDERKVNKPVFNMNVNGYTNLLLDAGTKGHTQHVCPSPHPLFSFFTEDIAASYEYVQKLGYTIHSPIQEFDDIAFFVIKDLDGNLVMICAD